MASAGAGFALGLSQEPNVSPPGNDRFVEWLQASADRSIELVVAASADHELRDRGASVLTADGAMAGVPFQSLNLRLAQSAGPTAEHARDGHFTTQAIVQYRLPIDQVRVGRRADAVFRYEGGRWRLVQLTPSGEDLWDHEPVASARSGRVLVLGANGDGRLSGLASLADQVRTDVAAFWSAAWPKTAVVVLPSQADLLDPLLGTDSGSDQVAVTLWQSGLDGPVVRVMLNPTYYDEMLPLAREIVLRHEITHVAQDALPQDGIPNWLSEGVAEYVGYRGTGISGSVIAARLYEQVRASGAPERLPTGSAFSFTGDAGERRVAYESGWTFVQMLVDTYGERTIVPFYAAVSKGEGTTAKRLDTAAERVYDASFDDLVEQWRSWLESNA